jgi:hypothetical protein
MPTAEDVKKIVAEQLKQVADPERREALAAHLVEPFIERRMERGPWYDVWIVAKSPENRLMLAYCASKHGDPWGVVSADNARLMESDWWFLSLDDAFIVSGMWKGPWPPGYEVQ